jgi:hypothetical protein
MALEDVVVVARVDEVQLIGAQTRNRDLHFSGHFPVIETPMAWSSNALAQPHPIGTRQRNGPGRARCRLEAIECSTPVVVHVGSRR